MMIQLYAGTRFQTAGNKNEEKDVDPKHEDQVDCLGYHRRLDTHHHSFRLPWLQVLVTSSY